MKKLLLVGLFPVFLASFVSKWYIDLGFRIPYFVPIGAAWCALAVIPVTSRRTKIPQGILILLAAQLAYLAAVIQSSLPLTAESQPLQVQQFMKGAIMELAEALLIAMILIFVATLSQQERWRALRLYLAAVACHMAFMLAEAFGMYVWGFDLDEFLSARIPLASEIPVTMSTDRFSLGGLGTIYRLSGLTGDPNSVGVALALALPVIFYLYSVRPRRSLVLLALCALLLVGSTFSNTAIPVAGLLVVALTFNQWKRRRRLFFGIMIPLVGGGAVLVAQHTQAFLELLAFKLPSEGQGTGTTHLNIALDALRLWQQHPFGVGLNNFAIHSPHISTHNSYVQALVELGVPGLLVLLGWAATGIWLGLQCSSSLGKAAALAVAALAIAANGHDLLLRFEFQLLTNLLLAMAVMDHATAKAAAPARTSESAALPSPR